MERLERFRRESGWDVQFVTTLRRFATNYRPADTHGAKYENERLSTKEE